MNAKVDNNSLESFWTIQEEERDSTQAVKIDFPTLLTNLFDPNQSQENLPILIDYLRHHKVKSIHYEIIKELLMTAVNLINDEKQKNDLQIIQFINLFYEMIYDDTKISHFLIQNGIHQIFFPYFNTLETMKLYKELLILDKAPKNLQLKSDLPKDHDQKQISYEQICLDHGYHTVVHFCIDNGVISLLLNLLQTELRSEALKLIAAFGHYFYAAHEFLPVFQPLLNIFFEDANHLNKSLSLKAISIFAGKSKESLNFFLIPQLIRFFVAPPLDSPKMIKTLLFLAKNIMKLSYYIEDPQIILTILQFVIELLKGCDESLFKDCIVVFSKGTKSGDSFLQICLDHGIVQEFFELIESHSFPFHIKSQLFITLCNFFEVSSFENSVRIVECGFFPLLSDFLDSIGSHDDKIMTAALDALNNALNLASHYSEVSDWKELIFEDPNIIESILKYDCGDEWEDFPEDSVEIYAHAFLQNYNSYQQNALD